MSDRRDRTWLPDLGPRGEGWVVLQFALLLAVIGSAISGSPWPAGADAFAFAAGVLALASGAALAFWGSRALGAALTPLPRPSEDATFRNEGAYRFVRHPIYGGVLLLAVGGTLISSPVAVLPTVLLGLLFEGKRRREEAWLTDRYPEYVTYRARVRRKFLPFVW